MDDQLRLLLRQVDPAVLGARIKSARLAAGLTQSEAAGEKASTPYVSRIEAGQRRPDLELLSAIAERVGSTAEELLTGIESSKHDELRLRLDYAELSFVTGDLTAALGKVEGLAAEADTAGIGELSQEAGLLHARILEGLGRVEESIEMLRTLVTGNDNGPTWLEASMTLASCYCTLGDPHRAITICEEALERLRDLGLVGSPEAVKLSLLAASAYYQVGSVDRAARLGELAVQEAERLGADEALALAYWNASIREYEAGRADAAIELAERALACLDRLEDALRHARLRNQVAKYQLQLDPPQTDKARENLHAVAHIYESTPARPLERLRNRMVLAHTDFLDGELTEAAENARAVLEAPEADLPPLLAASAYILLGRIAFAHEDKDAALATFREAVLQLTRGGVDRSIGQVWFELAGHLEEAGDEHGAREAYRNAGVSLGLRNHALRPARADEARGLDRV